MRLLLAMMKHETNTFSPVVTDLARFARGGGSIPPRGAEAIAAYRGTGTVTGAFIDIAEREGAEIEMAIAADAWPSGPVEDDAYAAITDAILAAVKKGGFDAILLDLHGAMVTRSHEDGEGTLLSRIRAIDPKTPIAVGYDMHSNVYQEMVAQTNVVAGYQTYPHVDMYETGRRAGDALMRMLKGEVRPTTAWGNVPMLPHVMRQGTDDEPNRSLQARAREMEKQGALCASVFVGFPHADIRNAGLSAVVVTDNDQAQAERLRDELLKQAWDAREQFVYRIEKLEDSVARAKAMTEGPVILLDHYDNAASGGTMDTTRVLAEILRQGLENVAAFAIFDPPAVEQAIAAGIGAQVTLSIGGKLKMPMLPAESPSARGERAGEDDLRREVPRQGPDVARRAPGHGPRGGARYRPRRDRAHLAPRRAVRCQCAAVARHRPDAEALCDAEEPHPLACRHGAACQSRGRVRGGGGVHFGLRAAHVSQGAAADFSAGLTGGTR